MTSSTGTTLSYLPDAGATTCCGELVSSQPTVTTISQFLHLKAVSLKPQNFNCPVTDSCLRTILVLMDVSCLVSGEGVASLVNTAEMSN